MRLYINFIVKTVFLALKIVQYVINVLSKAHLYKIHQIIKNAQLENVWISLIKVVLWNRKWKNMFVIPINVIAANNIINPVIKSQDAFDAWLHATNLKLKIIFKIITLILMRFKSNALI